MFLNPERIIEELIYVTVYFFLLSVLMIIDKFKGGRK